MCYTHQLNVWLLEQDTVLKCFMTLFEIRDVVVTACHKDVLLRFVWLMVHPWEGCNDHTALLSTILSTVGKQDVTSSFLFIYVTSVYMIAIIHQYIFRRIVHAGIRDPPR